MHTITTKANLTRVRPEDLKDARERPLVGFYFHDRGFSLKKNSFGKYHVGTSHGAISAAPSSIVRL